VAHGVQQGRPQPVDLGELTRLPGLVGQALVLPQPVEPALTELVIPITAVIIVLLFAVQRRGTASVGRCSAQS
jgi:hypothetical protein